MRHIEESTRFTVTLASLLVLFLAGCTPSQYMPRFDEATLRKKQIEISSQVKREPIIVSGDPLTRLTQIYNLIAPYAKEACIVNGEKWLDYSCSNWKLEIIPDSNFNAFATPDRKIVFTSEVFKYVKSDDEIAFILAHEMAHHILNHLIEDVVNGEILGATTGILSGMLMGAIASGLGANQNAVSSVVEQAVADGYASGRETGRLAYSVDQEVEADKFALGLLSAVGYRHRDARQVILFMGSDSKDLYSTARASHPSSPERLAAFDFFSYNASMQSSGASTPSSSQKLLFKNGDVYVGAAINGKPSGIGEYNWSHGDSYIGEFSAGQAAGKGKYVWADGSYYIGEWADGEMTGLGLESSSGSVRKGRWKNNEFLYAEEFDVEEFDSFLTKSLATPSEPLPIYSTQNALLDQDIEKRVADAIHSVSLELKNANFSVNSFRGQVLLTGEVSSGETKRLVGAAVKDLSLVRSVHNELEIAGTNSTKARIDDSTLRKNVKKALVNSTATNASRIKVVTANGAVYLLGWLSKSESEAAVDITRQIFGVQKIVKIFEYQN